MRRDPRRFPASCVLRVDGKPVRVQLSPAEIYGGPEGHFRARVNRRWHDGVDGQPLFMDRAGLADFLAGLLAAGTCETPPRPEIFQDMRVMVGRPDAGEFELDEDVQGWTYSGPILGHDRRWYVLVSAFGRRWFARCEDVAPLPCKQQPTAIRRLMRVREDT